VKQPKILDLRPTQFVLGMKEIESKISKMEGFTKKQLKDYCDDHQIPVVIGPKKELYMIDHHHFARACWELNIGGYSVNVLKDVSHKNEQDFWNFMIREEWCYLSDQFGMGPHSPFALPSDIRCLADDPYRSLVWAVLDAGLIKKEQIPFFEFKWAGYFRFNLDLSLHSKSNFKTAIDEAKKLSRAKGARGLPGFTGKKE
jgi:hypothetical protein